MTDDDTNSYFFNRRHLLRCIAMGFMASTIAAVSVQAQGLPGTTLGTTQIPGRAPIPDLIPGKDDKARWQLLTGLMPQLIGMSKTKVRKIFGPGASRENNRLTYQVTQGRSKKSGELACIELRISFKNDQVEEYSISALRWH